MSSIEERFRDAAGTAMPPSRLTADGVYVAAFRRRRRRVVAVTAAGLVAALVVTVVGVDVLRSGGDNRVAVTPESADDEQPPPWLRDGAVVTAVATGATHVYAVVSVCRPNESCTYRLVGSDDAGTTWTVRQDRFGTGFDHDLYAPAVGVLHQVQSHDNPDYVEADPDSPKTLVEHLVSTDGGRTWTALRRTAQPVDAVPAGGWLVCEHTQDRPCELRVYDPATASIAPLRNGPGFTVSRVASVPPAVGFWLSGPDVLATTPDRGRTWTTHADDTVVGPVSADGVTGYSVVVDSYPVRPTGPNPTSSPSESHKRVYRTGDGGRSWQRVDPDRTLPDGPTTIVQSYVAADGTHVVLTAPDGYARTNPAPFDRYTSDDTGGYRRGGVTGLGDRLLRDRRDGEPVRTDVAGVYVARDDQAVYLSTDGLTWTRRPVDR